MGLFSRGAAQGADAPLPLPYADMSMEGLAARWVRWAASVGPMHNPVLDQTGADAGLNQPPDVFFIAGNFGGVTERTVPVPAGLPLFMPVFNVWLTPSEGPPEELPEAFGDVALDGVPLGARRVSTPEPFMVAGVRLNPVTRSHKALPTVVSGLWQLVAPPAAGAHELRIVGGDGHGFVLDVTAHLQVG